MTTGLRRSKRSENWKDLTQSELEILSTLRNLSQSYEEEIHPYSGDLVLILGSSGSEKSIIRQILTGNRDDPAPRVSFYEFPQCGNGNHSTVEDLALIVFLQTVLSRSISLKILIVVNYTSLEDWNFHFRQCFDVLSELVENIPKYGPSVGLVVTHPGSNQGQNSSNAKIISDVRNLLLNGMKFANNTAWAQAVTTFLELGGKDRTLSKIGILQIPAGNAPVLPESKAELQVLVRESLVFRETNNSGLGFTSDNTTRVEFSNLRDKLMTKFLRVLGAISEVVVNRYIDITDKASNSPALLQQTIPALNADIEKINQFLRWVRVNQGLTISNAFKRLVIFLTDLVHRVQLRHVDAGLELSEDVDLLSFVVPPDTAGVVRLEALLQMKLLEPMTGTIIILEASLELYRELSTHALQKSKPGKLINGKRLSDSVVTPENFGTFLNLVGIPGNWTDSEKYLTQAKLGAVNDVLRVAIREEQLVNCSIPGKLTISGFHILVSQATLATTKNFRCPNNTKVHEVTLLARHTIFIDQNINLAGEETNFKLIAPNWEVVGNRTIRLDGLAGRNSFSRKAPEVYTPGGRGNDGAHGVAGGNAGNFFGVATFIANEDGLIISANGGQGGNGQDGGDGRRGRDGSKACMWCQVSSSHFRPTGSYSTMRNDFEYGISPIWINLSPDWNIYKLYGEHGSPGGNGGNGGLGGSGGRPGKVLLIGQAFQDPNLKLITVSLAGRNGVSGLGGTGGGGGKNGDSKIVKVKERFIELFWGANGYNWEDGGDVSVYTYQAKGANGLTGKSSVGRSYTPTAPNFKLNYEDLNTAKFAACLHADAPNLLDKVVEQGFQKVLYTDQLILREYDLDKIVQEFHQMESLKQTCPSPSNLGEMYELFLEMIAIYGEVNRGSLSSDQKTILRTIYSATLSGKNSAQESKESNLIVNFESYLTSMENQLTRLDRTKLLTKNNFLKSTFRNSTRAQIQEGHHFIQTYLIPDLNSFSDDMKTMIVSAAAQRKVQGEEQVKRLRQEKQDFQRIARFTFFGNVLKKVGAFVSTIESISGTILQFLGSTIVGANSEASKNLIQSSVLNFEEVLAGYDSLSVARILEVIPRLKKLTREMAQLNSSSLIRSAVETLVVEAQKNHILPQNIVSAYRKLENYLFSDQGIDPSVSETVRELKSIVIAINSGATEIVETFRGSSYLETYDFAIAGIEAEMHRLREIENHVISEIIVPAINRIKAIPNLVSSNSNTSRIGFKIKELEMRQHLNSLKEAIVRMTSGFGSLEPRVDYALGKVSEGLTMLTQIYDQIQRVTDEERLWSFISDVNNPAEPVIQEPKLQATFLRIRDSLEYNLLLSTYRHVINGFLQWVFPFAPLYVRDFEPPPPSLGTDSVVENIQRQVHGLKSKLHDYKHSIVNNHDEYIHEERFQSGDSTEPFHTWNSAEIKESLENMFSGWKVTVFADVTRSHPWKNAIKFNVIGLNFVIVGQEGGVEQSSLNQILKSFKLRLTHLGNSYYRYNGEYFLIRSSKQTILSSFEKDSYGEPLSRNSVYTKLRNGDLMLSPYAMWEIGLEPVRSGLSFTVFQNFRNLSINLELVGSGKYVGNLSTVANLNEYYETIDEPRHLGISNERF